MPRNRQRVDALPVVDPIRTRVEDPRHIAYTQADAISLTHLTPFARKCLGIPMFDAPPVVHRQKDD